MPAIKDEARYPADGKVVVVHTADGGATWTEQRDGLPQDEAYDLIWRHGLPVAPDGDPPACGSTTGSLWHSRDGGGWWHLIKPHLPPLHAVHWVA